MAIHPLDLANTASLTFKAAFVSLSLWNGTSGTWSTDFWYDPLNGNGNTLAANGEQEWYINANDPATKSIRPWMVSNNLLTITAAAAPGSLQPLIDNYQYTSGELNTFHSFSQTYGYFEMRAKLPAGQGLWPAFWLLPENGSWPPELDVMEMLGSDPTTLYTTVHTGEYGGNTGIGIAVKVPDMSKGFHNFGVDWEAKYITWYFDGKAVYRVPTPSDMHQPMFIEANLAAGGYWPGNVDPGKLPAQMQIQYIAAYSALPAGKTLVAGSDPHLVGTKHKDTFYPGAGGVEMTGDGGADVFVFDQLPTAVSTIDDFDPACDKLDVSALLAAAGYQGSDPIGSGYLSLVQNGGDTLVSFDPDGPNGPRQSVQLVLLANVAPGAIDAARNIVIGNKPGKTIAAAHTAGQVLIGTSGNDALYAGSSSVTMTGGRGADRFVFDQLPASPGQITDFRPGVDRIDLSMVLASVGYHGRNPVGDGYLQFASTAGGSTNVLLDPDGPNGPDSFLPITVLDGIAPSSLNMSRDVITAPRKGKTLTGDDTPGQVLIGTPGNDTFYAGHNSVVMTGRGGWDVFDFNDVPWNAGEIKDFDPSSDKLNVVALLAAASYQGTTPFTDGILSVAPTNDGGTQLHFHPSGPLSDIMVTTLDAIAPSDLDLATNFIIK